MNSYNSTKHKKETIKFGGVNKQIKKIENTITSDIKFLEKDTINITFKTLPDSTLIITDFDNTLATSYEYPYYMPVLYIFNRLCKNIKKLKTLNDTIISNGTWIDTKKDYNKFGLNDIIVTFLLGLERLKISINVNFLLLIQLLGIIGPKNFIDEPHVDTSNWALIELFLTKIVSREDLSQALGIECGEYIPIYNYNLAVLPCEITYLTTYHQNI